MNCSRTFKGVAAVLLAASFALTPAQAQDYPSKPLKFIVPTAPAGIGDMLARMFQQKLGEAGNPTTIVVENRAGAAGVIGTDAVAKAAPDGTTFLVGNHAVLAMLPHLQKIPYDPIKDFTPVILGVTVPNILVVHPSVPAKSVPELVAYAKANPGKLTYASQGVGASGHIAAELFKLQAGIDIVHVPYKGAAPAAQDLAAGHVNMMFDVVSLALGPIQSGRVRPLGVTTKQRVAVLPDVPTMIEQGGAGRDRRLVWLPRSRGDAACRHRLAQPRNHQDFLDAGHQRPVCQSRRRGAARHAGVVRAVHRGGIQPLRRRHQAGWDQAGVTATPAAVRFPAASATAGLSR